MHPRVSMGLPLSAAAHAGLIALALWALPWLKARPGPPVPVVEVSLVTAAELAALVRDEPTPEAPAAAPPPQTVEVAPIPELPLWKPEPGTEEAIPEVFDLAPQFDAAAPLGIEDTTTRQLAPPRTGIGQPPRTREAPVPEADLSPYRSFEAAVGAAIARAQIYPRAALDRGIAGSLEIWVRTTRDGRLVGTRLARSSGSVVLDRAGLEAARRARLPAAPADLPGQVFDVAVRLDFAAGR